jgi:hypothetical protein
MKSLLHLPLALATLALAACNKPGSSSDPAAADSYQTLTVGIEGKLSFNTHIQPILSEYCYHCHGPDSGTRQPESEPLRLDIEEEAFKNRDGGQPVIIKGDPARSLLVQLMKSQDRNEIMPPPESHKEMKPEQIALIERWIAEGAEYEDHWAFTPPTRPQPPTPAHPDSVRNPIDNFIQQKLAAKNLPPAPPEDPRTLARRAALDLTGLLPDPADVESFAKNPTEEAWQSYLEKLFASPAYAEHRTRYWLDYSRYADTHGLHFDNVRSIWPYRDYVIRSFAAHKPYDQFVREQIAGDLIPAKSADEWIATGYIRCNVSTNEGGTIPEEIHANNTRDRAEAFGAAFLGLTVGCASCHDHKFDPISQKDFYSIAAFFNNGAEKPWDSNIADPRPILRIPADEKRPELDALVAKHSAAAAKYHEHRTSAPARFTQWLAAGNKPTPVATDALELRLRFDEGKGDTLANSAPNPKTPSYTAITNPLVWGESVWLWPAARLDIAGEIILPDQGDFEATESFSTGFWTRLRMKVGGGTTGNGSLIARMGSNDHENHRGWDVFVQDDKLVVHIIHQWPNHAIRVETPGVPRGEWVHLGVSYDGSARAEGVKLFINGKLSPTTITHNSIQPGQTIRTKLPLNLGRRHEIDQLRESSFQDLRLYRRALTDAEFAKLPFEDLASEIIAKSPDPTSWSPTQQFIVLDRFFLGNDPDAQKLQAEISTLDQQIEQLGNGGTPTLITRELPEPAHAWILDRGVYTARSQLVHPASPEFLPSPIQNASRLQLAEWLFSPENPLFARVTVNRVWQELFGTGIVDTPDDFGIMGAHPTHPELLDWLAVEFRESGWNLKHIYQLILTSHTYRQSNHISPEQLAADPANRLISRGPRFRMDAEVLRDTALQASGLLVGKIGGPPVKPYQPDGIWDAVSMPESNTKKYQQDAGENLYRRSLYTFWKRFAPPPSLETFDAQAREVVCVRRARTNTPLQALVSMNDPQFFEAARKLAERAILHSPETPARLHFIASILLSRPLTEKELASLTKSLERYAAHYQANPNDAQALLTTGASPPTPNLPPTEIATWTLISNQLLNLDETLTK